MCVLFAFHRPFLHVTFSRTFPLSFQRMYPLFVAVIRLVAVEMDAIVSGISMSHSARVPREGRREEEERKKNNIVVSSTSRLTSAVSDERGSSLGRKSANWIILERSCLGKKSGMEGGFSDMLPRGGGLAEAARLLLTATDSRR